MKHKSIGYHAFNTHAFAMLKDQYPTHKLWQNPTFRKIVNFLQTDEYKAGIQHNEFSFAYNPPGFEVPVSLQQLQDEKPAVSEVQSWIQQQIDHTYNWETGLFDKDTQDISTLTARLYELTRLDESLMRQINIK